MKLRCRAHLSGTDFLWHLPAVREETFDHLALKLAACLMFSSQNPIPDPSPSHPALQDQDFRPDVMGLDVGGYVKLWVECGQTSMHKMEKVARRFQQARIVVITRTPHEARQFRAALKERAKQAVRAEVWSFPENRFAQWRGFLGEDTYVVGEAGEKSLNLVVNDQTFVTELDEIS